MYDIDDKLYKQKLQTGWAATIIGIAIAAIIAVAFLINFPAISLPGLFSIFALFVSFVIPLVSFGIRDIYKGSKNLKYIRHLNEHGKLLKNIPCHIEYRENPETNTNEPVIVVECILGDESQIVLRSDPDFIPKVKDRRRTIDLVIDVNNPSYYFLGFNINRIGGNREYDFYTPRGFNYAKDNNKK